VDEESRRPSPYWGLISQRERGVMAPGRFAWIAPSLVAAAAVVGLGCSGSTGPTLSPRSLAGSYTLANLAVRLPGGGTEGGSPPGASGMLRLTDSTYKVFATVDTGLSGKPDTAASDSGTYAVRGSTLIETSATGQPTDTATASLHSHNDTLDVNVTAPANVVAQFVWVRTQ
jgi:hypothetical protein